MKLLPVRLKHHSYDIVLGHLGRSFGIRVKKLGYPSSTRIALVTSQNLVRVGHAANVKASLNSVGYKIDQIVIPDKESNKNHATLLSFYQTALSLGLDRKSLIVAVGGGVITDVAGFFAATFMRGIPYLSVPTTLLGMVDASIGGKTAVDLVQGKNLVGAFWQPRLVWQDPDILQTLPKREWKTGMAEVVKYGVILDAKFFEWLERKSQNCPDPWEWSSKDLSYMLSASSRLKSAVVVADEKEIPLKGGREILNFGHTIGHALESATNYAKLSHGEAISLGMIAAGRIALQNGLWSEKNQSRLLALLKTFGLPTHMLRMNSSQLKKFWSAIKRDKKNIEGRLRFVLPLQFGRVKVISDIPAHFVHQALKF